MFAVVQLDMDTGASEVVAEFTERRSALNVIEILRDMRRTSAIVNRDGTRTLSPIIHGIRTIH